MDILAQLGIVRTDRIYRRVYSDCFDHGELVQTVMGDTVGDLNDMKVTLKVQKCKNYRSSLYSEIERET